MSILKDQAPTSSVKLLGRPQTTFGSVQVSIPEKAYALIALLATSPRLEVHRRDARTMLWGGQSPNRQAGNLRQLLLRLSKLDVSIEPLVIALDGQLRLSASAWTVDVVEMMRPDAIDLDQDFVPDWLLSGELLEGLGAQDAGFEEWLSIARRQIADRRAAGIATLLSRSVPLVDPETRARLAEILIALEPTEEIGHRALMTAHREAGRTHFARRAWSDCKAILRSEARASPSAETSFTARSLGLEPLRAVPETRVMPAGDGILAPRVIMMPPVGLSEEPLFERLGQALVEDVTVGLSQYRSFRIIAAHTGYALARLQSEGLSGDMDGPRFDYEVTTRIRGGPNALSASCRLTRLSDGEVIWAFQFPIDAVDLKTSLDVVVRKIVVTLADAVDRAEYGTPIDDNDPSGYRLFLEGRRVMGGTRLETLRQARRWFKAAVKRCDGFSAAFAGLSRTYSMEWLVRGMTDEHLLDASLSMARRSRDCDPGSGRALRELGFVALYRKRHDESLERFAEARSLMPNDGDLLADQADALLHDGRTEEARQTMVEALEVNPLPPDYYRWIDASIRYQAEDYQGAVHALEPVSERVATSRLMAASCAMAGRKADAFRYAAVVRENYPGFRVDQVWKIVPDRCPEHTRQLIEGLTLAGLN